MFPRDSNKYMDIKKTVNVRIKVNGVLNTIICSTNLFLNKKRKIVPICTILLPTVIYSSEV